MSLTKGSLKECLSLLSRDSKSVFERDLRFYHASLHRSLVTGTQNESISVTLAGFCVSILRLLCPLSFSFFHHLYIIYFDNAFLLFIYKHIYYILQVHGFGPSFVGVTDAVNDKCNHLSSIASNQVIDLYLRESKALPDQLEWSIADQALRARIRFNITTCPQRTSQSLRHMYSGISFARKTLTQLSLSSVGMVFTILTT